MLAWSQDNTTALYQRLVGLLTVQLQARLILQLSKSNSKVSSLWGSLGE
jgi:hypothetical protein